MANVDELEALAVRWLKRQRGKLTLQRSLYLVPGLQDEDAGCWKGQDSITYWGPRVFTNWNPATVHVFEFELPYARPMESFFDFGDDVREVIASRYPDRGSPMGEYDIVGHSMGGLDAFAALFDDADPNRPKVPKGKRIAKAFNFVTMDTPFRGVPNMPTRRTWAEDFRQGQCDALTPGSPELGCVAAAAPRIGRRAMRVTCYAADGASQVEVDSADLLFDAQRWDFERRDVHYQLVRIPGASHSGSLGVTTSVITIANLFATLTRPGPAAADLRV